MSKFVQAVQITPLTFKGEQVTAKLRPIKRKLFVQLLPLMQDIAEVKKDGGNDRDPRIITKMNEALDIVAPVIKDYVVEFQGPTDGDGKPVALEDVMESAYFLEAALHLAMELVKTANVEEDAEGKSERPSGA